MTTENKPAIDITTSQMGVALINIKPETDLMVIRLKEEITKLKEYAINRSITCDEDIKPFTDDLSLIANLKKALADKKAEYCKPIKDHLAAINEVFSEIEVLLDVANSINRTKVKTYRDEQIKRQAEADELNRQALELARKQAEFSGTGEHTVDLTPMEAEPVINKVTTSMGGLGFVKHWKWEIVDRSIIPADYMIVDGGRITKEVGKGVRVIPGIRIWCEEEVRVNAK